MKYGINSIGPKFFDGAAPDLAVAGPNVRLQFEFPGGIDGHELKPP